MTEVWKDIKGYEGRYQVSSLGKVKNQYGDMLSPIDNRKGYYRVVLMKNNTRNNQYIHRLVAMAFLENPNNKRCVNHKDFDTHNNRIDNLEWCTQKENMLHSSLRLRIPHNGYKVANTGERYITYTGKSYRLQIRSRNGLYIDKCFQTLQGATEYRNTVVGQLDTRTLEANR